MPMNILRASTVNDAFLILYNILSDQAENGFEEGSRDGSVVGELINVAINIDDPTRNIVSTPIRKMPMRYAVGELLWYLSGSDKTKDIAQYAPKWLELSDDGEHTNSAYGYRIKQKFGFDQWEYVKALLRKDPTTRQAVIHIKDADNTPTKDTPCTVYLQFFIREGKLHLATHMRSNDLWMGFTYDAFSFCAMQVLMAMELGVDVGEYTHFAGSLHIYGRDYAIAKKNAQELAGRDKKV